MKLNSCLFDRFTIADASIYGGMWSRDHCCDVASVMRRRFSVVTSLR